MTLDHWIALYAQAKQLQKSKEDFSLTDKGEKIGPILNEIYRWSVENYAPLTEEVKDDFYNVFK